MPGMGDLDAAKALRDSFGSTKPPRIKNKKNGGAGPQSIPQGSTQRQPNYPPHGNHPQINSEYPGSRRGSYLASHPTASGQDIHPGQGHITSRQLDPINTPKAHPDVNHQPPFGHHRGRNVHAPAPERSHNSTNRPPWQGQLVTSYTEFAAEPCKPPSLSSSAMTEATTAAIHSPPQAHVFSSPQSDLTSVVSKSGDATKQVAVEHLIDFAEPQRSEVGFPTRHAPTTGNFMQKQTSSQRDANCSFFGQTESPKIPEYPVNAQQFPPYAAVGNFDGQVTLAFTRHAYKEGPEDVQMGGMDTTPLPSKKVGLSGSAWNPQNTQESQVHAEATPAEGTVSERRPPSSRLGPLVTSGTSQGFGLKSSRWCNKHDEDEEL